MKALSLWQPWASLVVSGTKSIETRSWSTKYRGPLLIHAAKRKMTDADYEVMSPLVRLFNPETDFPLGAIVGKVELLDCRRTEALRDHITYEEKRLGNYDDGRYGWILGGAKLWEPVYYKGAQGLFSADVDEQKPCTACGAFTYRKFFTDSLYHGKTENFYCRDCQIAVAERAPK